MLGAGVVEMSNFWNPVQKIIEDVCVSFDAKWQKRKRVIDTLFLVLFIFKLVLSKNQQGYKSVLNELWEQQALTHYQQRPLSSSSLCESRQKLPEEIFIEINKAILLKREETLSLSTWHGHRVFAVDGSKINLPHELLAMGYKAPNREQYYPQGVMSTVYHLGSGLIYDCLLIKSGVSERHAVIKQMDMLSPGDVLVLDRGYFSYLVLYQAMEKNIHLVCRLQFGTMNKEIKSFCDSNLTDTIIDYFPSEAVKSAIKKQGFHLNYRKIKLRLIKYQINNEMYVCGTTLIGKEYPLDEFPGVYHGRWGIEELYKISKEFINVEDMHSKTERGVKQELYAHALLINIARIFEAEVNNQLPPPSVKNQKKADDIQDSYWQDFCERLQAYKVNFKNCLLVISRHIENLILSAVQEVEDFLLKMLSNITNVRQKIRPGRHYPRRSRRPYTKWQNGNFINSKRVEA